MLSRLSRCSDRSARAASSGAVHLAVIASIAASGLASPWQQAASAGEPVSYIFVPIADNTGELSPQFGSPDVNDDGVVVFRGVLDDGVTLVIYTGDGGPLTPQATTGSTFINLGGAPVINSAGTVAFWAEVPGGFRAIYTADNASLSPVVIADGTVYLDLDLFPSINDAGSVSHNGHIVFPCCGPDTGIGVNGGVTYSPASAFFALNVGTVNASGLLAFNATLDTFTSGIFTGSGGPSTTIATTADGFTVFPAPPMINDSGAVAFIGWKPDGSKGIFIGDGGPLTTVTTTAGPFDSFSQQGIGFNNAGDVAFLGILDRGDHGIFTGPDPATDRVIRVGDELFGSIVYSLDFVSGLNNRGDIAFTYILENESGGAGVSGVALARAPLAALPADIDGDGDVDGADLGLLLGQWGTSDPAADINNDGTVDGADLGLLLGAWTG